MRRSMAGGDPQLDARPGPMRGHQRVQATRITELVAGHVHHDRRMITGSQQQRLAQLTAVTGVDLGGRRHHQDVTHHRDPHTLLSRTLGHLTTLNEPGRRGRAARARRAP
jgi:hypothetical protein